MIDKSVNWPGGARIAVMLTFDFDAETLWTSRDPANARRPGILSQGVYGAKVGVPKILETLRDEGLKATFFVPGWTAEHHPQRTEMIVAGGHEVAHHSYSHNWIDPDYPEKEVEEMERGLEALKRVVGVVPRGYFSIKSPRPIFPNSHILEIFQDEFREIYRWGGLYNLVMHPQVIGRPSRIALLREIIGFIRSFPNVWFATGTEVAEAWSAAHDA
ncbi:polysaccharide deacetylase family protein [Belnapia sp. T18]|uniref:Chitooligosaccharide deacetylase n=1 Tax=Belnapia arida TaxID=2804533 RepID=A0ABS1UBF3_9PROT|nr:polysaccharide deacetylase family protein [Belnapia arida]MBL6082011.1 polysaccharide deacetylase family protein [Belnapia arida]